MAFADYSGAGAAGSPAATQAPMPPSTLLQGFTALFGVPDELRSDPFVNARSA